MAFFMFKRMDFFYQYQMEMMQLYLMSIYKKKHVNHKKNILFYFE